MFAILLLYAPFIAGSGLSFLFTAAINDSIRLSLSDIPQYYQNASFFFTGTEYGFLFLFFLSILLLFWKEKVKTIIPLITIMLIVLPVFTCLLQNIQIEPRAIAFIGLSLPLLFGDFLSFSNPKTQGKKVTAGILLIGFSTAVISHNHPFLNWSKEKDKKAKELANTLLRAGVTTCYDSSNGSDFFYYYPALEYFYRMKKESFVLNTNAENSLRYTPFSYADKYDCIVLHYHSAVQPKEYRQVYQNKAEDIRIFIRN